LMKTLQRYFLATIVLLVAVLIVAFIQRNPHWTESLSGVLNSPLATPVKMVSRETAIQEARSGSRAGHLVAVSPLDVVSAELMRYDEATQLAGFGSDRPPDMLVWVVVLTGTWQLLPPPSSNPLPPPGAGAVCFIMSARDGQGISIGGHCYSPSAPIRDNPPLPTPWPPGYIPPPPVITTATVYSISGVIDMSPALPADQKGEAIVRRVDGTYIKILVPPDLTEGTLPLQPGDVVMHIDSPASSFGKYAPLPTAVGSR
jgi:hypothetical protein